MGRVIIPSKFRLTIIKGRQGEGRVELSAERCINMVGGVQRGRRRKGKSKEHSSAIIEDDGNNVHKNSETHETPNLAETCSL